MERIGRSRVGFGGVDPRVLFIPAAQAPPVWPMLLTGLIGVRPLWDLPWVICWTHVSLGRVGLVSSFLVWRCFA
jgi:hypothetical protein